MSSWPLNEDAALQLSRRFVSTARVRMLYGDTVQNVEVTDDQGRRYVLKITPDASTRTRASVELQASILRFLKGGTEDVCCQQPVPAMDGSTILEWHSEARGVQQTHLIWMVEYLDGRLLDEVPSYDDGLLASIGRSVASVDKALMSFTHRAADRRIRWDLAHILDLAPCTADIADKGRRSLIMRVLCRLRDRVLPATAACPVSVIHNDGGNQHNMLVGTAGPARIIGIIDFGDAVRTRRIFGLGIAAAYATFGCHDPRHAIESVCDGYAEVLELTPMERQLAPELAIARLAMSVLISSHRLRLEPENHYLQVSAEPAWRSLDSLADQQQPLTTSMSRSAS